MRPRFALRARMFRGGSARSGPLVMLAPPAGGICERLQESGTMFPDNASRGSCPKSSPRALGEVGGHPCIVGEFCASSRNLRMFRGGCKHRVKMLGRGHFRTMVALFRDVPQVQELALSSTDISRRPADLTQRHPGTLLPLCSERSRISPGDANAARERHIIAPNSTSQTSNLDDHQIDSLRKPRGSEAGWPQPRPPEATSFAFDAIQEAPRRDACTSPQTLSTPPKEE